MPKRSSVARNSDDPRRSLPSIHAILHAYHEAGGEFEEWAVKPIIQQELDLLRTVISSGDRASEVPVDVVGDVVARLRALDQPKLEPMLNGTGIIIHTNLGRAQVSAETAGAMARAATSSVTLELDRATNHRGQRMSEISMLMTALTGAESALLVNNNAAAILLTLSAMAKGREVIVSRGEAVEIGGGFRIPDVLNQSGAVMVEIGTTNRTYAVDYERAINAETAAMLKVHPSNFNITGFVHTPPLPELAAISRAKGVALIEDQGSGALLDPAQFGLTGERTVRQSLDEGVDLLTMSCDKLLGGPQGGILVGKRSMIDRIGRHPLARAVRADKTTLAGVAETLRHYARGEAPSTIPVWRMISAPVAELDERGRRICAEVSGYSLECVLSEATVGGGTLPGQTLPSLAISPELDGGADIDSVARRLRLGNPGVFTRIREGKLLIDLRTILPEDDGGLIAALVALGPALEVPG
jgi:L-seryl-tRNA(Ser) seleniumtransferase